MLPDDVLTYAASYQTARDRRGQTHGALFLPLEVLVDRATGTPHLSVSFSGSSSCDVYVTQRASLIRAVKVTTRWLILPWTVARVFPRQAFLDQFSELLESATVDGEPFWVFRQQQGARLKQLIASLPLDGSFREQFEHVYLPEPDGTG